MHYIVIGDRRIERCTQQYFQFVYFWRLFFNGHAVANGSHMLVCQTGKAFAGDLETDAGGALPVDEAAEDAVVHIQSAMIAQDGALIEAKAFTIDEEFD